MMTSSARLSAGESGYARRTRARILAAAERRFKHYGYAKTTIVDIASDCAMSHANVYRFFANKAELLDAIAAGWLAKSEDLCREIARRPVSARERLIELVVELHRWKRREFARDARAFELHVRASQEGRPFVGVHVGVLGEIVAGIVAEGTRSGEFAVEDARAAARLILGATTKFLHPLLIAAYAHESLEDEAREVVQVLVAGLASRPDLAKGAA